MGTVWGSACCDEGFHLIDEQTPGHFAGGLEDSAVHMHKGIVPQSAACRGVSQSQQATSQASLGLPGSGDYRRSTSWQHRTQDQVFVAGIP